MTSARTVTHTETFDVPASRIWSLLMDWGAIADWMPAGYICSLKLQGEGIGAVRYLETGHGTRVAERLDMANESAGILELSILDPLPWGLASYRARGTLEVLGRSRCRLTWRGSFSVKAPTPNTESLPTFLEKAYRAMFQGIRQATGGLA